MKSLKTIKAEMLADAATRAEFDAQAPEFETARELVAARAKAGLSQAQVAERMGTTQSTVARLESGRHHAFAAHGAALRPGRGRPRGGAH